MSKKAARIRGAIKRDQATQAHLDKKDAAGNRAADEWMRKNGHRW